MGKPVQRPKEAGEATGGRKNRGICNFLLSLLEDESYPQVQWTNREKGEFQIHWMHASSGAWIMNNDAETFRLWAKAKGKLEGRESNYKTWKANFRCAMKSRHELEEIPIPRGSPNTKKNVKFWKFTDIELVNGYKDGRNFDWRRPRTKLPSSKPGRLLNARRNKRRVDKDEKNELEDNPELSHQSSESCDAWNSSLQEIPSTTSLQSNYETEGFSKHEQLSLHMEEDNDFNSYGVGLLQILEQSGSDKDSVVPNLGSDTGTDSALLTDYQKQDQTDNEVIHQYDQLLPFHQIPSSFGTDQPFSDNLLLEQEWELFSDENPKKEVRVENKYFDIESNDVIDSVDPFFYESIYTEL